MTDKDVNETVERVINGVLTNTGRPARELEKNDILTDGVGLDSLDLAVMVVELERELGIDPFREGQHNVQTLGDLVSLYESQLTT